MTVAVKIPQSGTVSRVFCLRKGQLTKEKPDDMLPLKNMTDPREIPKSGPVTVGKEG